MTRKSETLIFSTDVVASFFADSQHMEIEQFKASQDLIDRISEVNGRASSFTTSAGEIADLVLEVEGELADAGLPIRARVGVTVRHRGAGPTASAYKHAAKATEVTLLRRSTGWVLTSVASVNVYPKAGKLRKIMLTPEQAEIVSKVALKPFTVAKPAVQSIAA